MRRLADYEGLDSCRASVLVNGGGRACPWGCLGLGVGVLWTFVLLMLGHTHIVIGDVPVWVELFVVAVFVVLGGAAAVDYTGRLHG